MKRRTYGGQPAMSRRGFHGAVTGAALGGMAARTLAGESPDSPGDSRFVIWDMHCHFANVPGATPQERLARLMAYADRLGIERLVLFLGIPPHAENPSPEQLVAVNNQVLEAIGPWSKRAFGFVYVNPNHVEASLAEMERCIRKGPMVGVKLWVARRCAASELDPIVRLATELRAVVFQHTWLKATGNSPGESTPMDMAALAARHPEACLICGHAGGDWERGIRAVRPFPNVILGTSGFDPTAGVIEMAVRELGPDRVMYGSDAPGRSLASQLGKVLGAGVSSGAKKMILAGNLQRVLRPILEAKGRVE